MLKINRSGAALVALLIAPATVGAQGLTGGLFGSTRPDTVNRDRMEVTLAVTEALDSDIAPELLAELPQGGSQTGGLSTMVIGVLDYAHTRRRARIGANVETAFRYYNRLNRFDALGHSGSIGADVRLGQNANLLIDQSAAFSPSYLYELFPSVGVPVLGEGIPTAPDYQLVQSNSYIYRSNIGVAVGPPRGMRFTASGGYDRTDFRGDLAERALRPKLDSYSARTGLSRMVSRNVRLLGEYEYKTGDFGLGVTAEHRFAFGAEYSRALSATRRANFRAQLAPSTVRVPESPFNTIVTGQLFRLQVDAAVDVALRRDWLVSGAFRRGVEYMALLAEPVLSDGGRVSVEGLITRRLDLLATAAFATGASALDPLNQIDTSTINTRLRYAFTRRFAAYTEYVYFTYDLRGAETLAPSLPRAFTQHGLRVGIMLWAPVF